jgi:hypothetical protein
VGSGGGKNDGVVGRMDRCIVLSIVCYEVCLIPSEHFILSFE